MKQIVIKYGIIAGIIFSAMIFAMSAIIGKTTDFDKGETIGYLFMVGGFTTVFFGIRELRDKVNGGIITFNQAFRTGLLITITGSVIYVISWMIYFHLIDNTFIERYTEYFAAKLQESGKPQAEIEKELSDFKINMENYRKPSVMILYTYLDTFKIGLIVSVLCAFMMRRKPQGE